MLIRPAILADLPAINAIYNHYVLNSTATYQTEPSTDAQRLEWFHAHDARHPILVAQLTTCPATCPVIGWASLSPFHTRSAFANSVEDSIYIHPDYHRRGLGRRFLSDLITHARALGHHTMIGVISADQAPSIALHQSLGFHPAGVLRQVGRKFDRWLDVAYLQLML